MRIPIVFAVLAALGGLLPARAEDSATPDKALQAVIAGPQRSPNFVARDAARHPLEELTFFGVTPHSAVVEIWPSGGYWTEILAPYLRDGGTYRAAVQADGAEAAKYGPLMAQKIASDPATYAKVLVTKLGGTETAIAPPGSADVVLTFRNLHNWMAEGSEDKMLAAFYTALKPGGILGIEEHRGQRSTPQDPKALDGYVRQDYATALAEKAGFRFVGSTEVAANPKDTANWPKGVWTLPPTYALGDKDRATYTAIGEADNFVMKFQKPGP